MTLTKQMMKKVRMMKLSMKLSMVEKIDLKNCLV